MNEPQASQSLPGSRIECRETDGQLVLKLPACPRRVLKHSGGLVILFVFLVGFFLTAQYVLGAFLLVVAAIGAFEVILLVVVVAVAAAPFLTTTIVQIAKERAVVKTVLYGREQVREYAMDAQSRARQWYSPSARRNSGADRSGPEGIEIGSDSYDPETMDADLRDESKPRFGEGLLQGELDWVEWRINQFLHEPTPANVLPVTPQFEPLCIEGLLATPGPRPENTKIRILEDRSESRIVFPNTVECRSYSGIRNTFWGLALLAYPLFLFIQWAVQPDDWKPPLLPALFALAVLLPIGLAEFLRGLTRLVGRRELRINPDTITYRTTLFGLGLPFRLPTAQVASVGLPRGGPRRARNFRNVAPTIGSAIRTAERELNYSEAVRGLSAEESQWIMTEVARRIDAARSGKSS